MGSRDFPDMDAVRQVVQGLPPATVVISGGARGVDSIAAEEARRHGLEVIVVKAEWDRLGKSAGMIRNGEIVRLADEVIAFWDGKSRGTRDTIQKAHAAGKPCRVVKPKR